MDGRPKPYGKPPTGRLLPRRERRPSIPGMEVIDAGFMQNSARQSHVTALDEPTRCPLTPKLPKLAVLNDAVPQRANTAVNCCKLPPLPCTLTFLSPEYPVKFAKEGIEMATLNNSSITGASVGRTKRLTPLKDLKKKDELLVKEPRKAAQRSTELIKNDKKAKTQAKNILSSPALIASKWDVCARKPQPPSKPEVRKNIGQRLRTKKTPKVTATALHNLNVEVDADVFVKTPIANIAEDIDIVEHGSNTTATNGCGTVSADISDEPATTSSCGDLMANRGESANLLSENDPLAHQETTVAPERVLEITQEITVTAPRATSSSKQEEILACRKARKQTEKSPILQPSGPLRSKVPVRWVSRSPELLLIPEMDECSPSNSKASSPSKSEESTPATIQPRQPARPRPPTGPRPPRRSNNRVRRPRSQGSVLKFIAYEEETEEDEQDRQMLEAMLLPWFQSKGRAP